MVEDHIQEDDDKRSQGVAVDLEALERHASDLFLHRFVDYIRKARGTHGRYLILRGGDAAAIRAAGDGSDETLDRVTVDPSALEQDPGLLS